MSNDIYLVCYKGDSIFDKLIRIITKKEYTHVGITTAENLSEGTYMACREDGGVRWYTEPVEQIDTFKIGLKTTLDVNPWFKVTEGKPGSMISDMGYDELKHQGHMGSVEWVARALNLGHPNKYTIDKLIEFSKLE